MIEASRRRSTHPGTVAGALVAGAAILLGSPFAAADKPAAAEKPSPLEKPAAARPTVAILYFDYAGKDGPMAMLRKGLAQMLISDLSGLESIRIVEREQLQAILEELKLDQTAKIDPQSANRVGKLLGARFMVLGGYFDLLDTLRADARVVEVETGRIVQSIGAAGKPGDFLSVEQKLGQELTRILGKELPARTAEPARPVRAKPPAQLKTGLALRYSRALDAVDKKDKAAAKAALQAIVKEQPDFRLAALDLDKLMQ